MVHATLPPETGAPDPRVARSRELILRAAAELLIESGAAGVTIEGVSERSGVAKTTIYRHWPSRSQLIFDAFRNLLWPEGAPPPRTDWKVLELREGLVRLLAGLVRGLTNSPWAPAVTALVDGADRDQEIRQLLHNFLVEAMAGARTAIASAVARGELAASVDPDVAVDMLVGPIFYRRLVSREAMGPGFAEAVVDRFLEGAQR